MNTHKFILPLIIVCIIPSLANSQTYDIETIESARLDNFNHVPQTQTNWCWAATLAEVINVTQGYSYSACDIATFFFSKNCCNYGPVCNYPNSIYKFDKIVKPFNLVANVYGRLSWETITNEIRNSRPVLIRVESNLGQGHFILIMGFDHYKYKNSQTIRKSVILSDPMYGYFIGDKELMGYSVTWNELTQGKLFDYNANWTHTALFEKDR